jgi:hypothetical protein
VIFPGTTHPHSVWRNRKSDYGGISGKVLLIKSKVLNQLLKQKITLGTKVHRAEEWASAFYYKLDAEGHHPEIMISHLPFK